MHRDKIHRKLELYRDKTSKVRNIDRYKYDRRPFLLTAAVWNKAKSNTIAAIDHKRSRLQDSPYFCVFKYVQAVKQRVWNEAENSERDWGETLKIQPNFPETFWKW